MYTAESIQALIQALREHRDGLRQFAMRRLAAMGVHAVPALLKALDDPNDATQEAAAITLRTIGSDAVPQLLAALNDPDRKKRWAAAWVLSSMGPEARQAVAEHTGSPAADSSDKPTGKSSTMIPAVKDGEWADGWLTRVRGELSDARRETPNEIVRPPAKAEKRSGSAAPAR